MNKIIEVKIKLLDGSVIMPSQGSAGASGLDLCAFLNESLIIEPFSRALISTGIAIALPEGFEGQIRPRSGFALRHGITVLNTPATIDSDYRGEIKVLLINLGEKSFVVESGMRIAQLVLAEFSPVRLKIYANLSQTKRGELGFGSTGIY